MVTTIYTNTLLISWTWNQSLQEVHNNDLYEKVQQYSPLWSELRRCVQVEMVILGSPSLTVCTVSVDVKQPWTLHFGKTMNLSGCMLDCLYIVTSLKMLFGCLYHVTPLKMLFGGLYHVTPLKMFGGLYHVTSLKLYSLLHDHILCGHFGCLKFPCF